MVIQTCLRIKINWGLEIVSWKYSVFCTEKEPGSSWWSKLVWLCLENILSFVLKRNQGQVGDPNLSDCVLNIFCLLYWKGTRVKMVIQTCLRIKINWGLEIVSWKYSVFCTEKEPGPRWWSKLVWGLKWTGGWRMRLENILSSLLKRNPGQDGDPNLSED